MISVHLPSQLTGLTNGKACLTVKAATLAEVFEQIDEIAPMVRSQIFDANGTIRQFVGLFLDGRQVVDVERHGHPVREGSQVLVVMSVAGG